MNKAEDYQLILGMMAVASAVGGNVAVVAVAVGYFVLGWSWLAVAVVFVAVAVAVAVVALVWSVMAFVAVAGAIGQNFQPRGEDGQFVPVYQNGKRRFDVLIPRKRDKK